MTTLITMLLLVQLNTSCTKEKAIEPCSNPSEPTANINANFTEVWNVNTQDAFTCMATVVTPNEVIYWTWKGAGHNDYMVAFNKTTGDTLWHRDAGGGANNHRLIGSYIYLDLDDRLVCIDPATGNEIWRYSPSYLSDYVYANGSIYAFFDQGHTADSTALHKINPLTGVGNHIYSVYTSDRQGFSPSPRGLAYWKHPNGNEILFSQSSGLNISVGRGEYFAIDITGDSMYWDLGNYFNYDVSGFTPLINGNNVIINSGTKGVASLDLITKTTNWNVVEPTVSQTGGKYAVLENGKNFKEAGNIGHFNVLDVANGSQLKTHTGIGTTFHGSPLRVYNNKVYFTTAEVIGIIDAITGDLIQKILYNEQIGDNLGGYPRSGLDVDPTNGYIYTTRGWSFVCIKEK